MSGTHIQEKSYIVKGVLDSEKETECDWAVLEAKTTVKDMS